MFSFEKKIGIIGIGGFGKEVLCCLIDVLGKTDSSIEELVCFFVSDEYMKDTKKILDIDVLPLSSFNPDLYEVIVAVGNPSERKLIVDSLPSNTKYKTIIHPNAIISKWVEIGEGSVVTAGTIITCNIKIGKHAHLNLCTTIGHDCVIGDFFTTAPGVNISGNCKFGDNVYIGTNACVKQGVQICNNVTIGMGGVVIKNITEKGVYIGNPVKVLQ